MQVTAGRATNQAFVSENFATPRRSDRLKQGREQVFAKQSLKFGFLQIKGERRHGDILTNINAARI